MKEQKRRPLVNWIQIKL